jgi:hypothetical protein
VTTATGHSSALSSPYLVVDDFLPLDLANAMRQEVDAHFLHPFTHRPDTHQVWNYWYVGGLYTYFRTLPEKVIRPELVDSFMATMRGWSAEKLGMTEVERPWLSFYVSGCRQGLHNDSSNGRFGFVYSLTRNEHKFSGGETIILNEGDLFRERVRIPSGGTGLYSKIEPRFNRLVVFDDRMPHAVETVRGSMNPIDGRLVFHGHIRGTAPVIAGPLAPPVVVKVVIAGIQAFFVRLSGADAHYMGPFVLRFSIGPSGNVESCDAIVDRVVGRTARDQRGQELGRQLIAQIQALKFPASEGTTTVTQPVFFGGALPKRPPGDLPAGTI